MFGYLVAVLLVPTIVGLAAVDPDPVEDNYLAGLDLVKCKSSGKDNYDYFTFVRQWTPNVCYKANPPCVKITPKVNYWTLHGLWPSKYSGDGPSNCGGNFDLVDKDLVDKVHKVWISVFSVKFKDDMAFWRYEYCTHGTCCTDVYPKAHSYFSKVLDLNKMTKYNMDTILKKAKIVANRNKGYEFAALNAAMRPTGYAKYRCRSIKESDGSSKQLLTEVSICLDKNLQPMDCRGGGQCDKKKQFYILPFSVLSEDEPQKAEL